MPRMYLIRDYEEERRARVRALEFRLVGLVVLVLGSASVGSLIGSLTVLYHAISSVNIALG
jgi:hypothetical protein